MSSTQNCNFIKACKWQQMHVGGCMCSCSICTIYLYVWVICTIVMEVVVTIAHWHWEMSPDWGIKKLIAVHRLFVMTRQPVPVDHPPNPSMGTKHCQRLLFHPQLQRFDVILKAMIHYKAVIHIFSILHSNRYYSTFPVKTLQLIIMW